MQEYAGEAIVLGSDPRGDDDLRITLFTKAFGKLVARAKSARKTISKLAGHLQPGNVVVVRLVDKNGPLVVDALATGRIGVPLPELHALGEAMGEADPDAPLWEYLRRDDARFSGALALLGWDPRAAACVLCGTRPVRTVKCATQEFFCGACALRMPADGVLSI